MEENKAEGQKELKRCPKCAEDVKAAAQICRFCGYSFETGEMPQKPAVAKEEAADAAASQGVESSSGLIKQIAAFVIAGLIILGGYIGYHKYEQHKQQQQAAEELKRAEESLCVQNAENELSGHKAWQPKNTWWKWEKKAELQIAICQQRMSVENANKELERIWKQKSPDGAEQKSAEATKVASSPAQASQPVEAVKADNGSAAKSKAPAKANKPKRRKVVAARTAPQSNVVTSPQSMNLPWAPAPAPRPAPAKEDEGGI